MPLYSVTLIVRNAPTPWNRTTLRVKAVSGKHAMKKAEGKLNNKRNYRFTNGYDAKSARLVPEKYQHSDYWHKIWKRAYDNMPTRMHVQKLEQWHEQERGATPLPEFIKQSAKGTMRQESDGSIYKMTVKRHAHRSGAEAALTKLLEYAKWNRQHSMAHYAVSNAMARGSRPATAARRELLIKLAGPDGTRIAAEMLSRRFLPMKIKGGK